MIKDGLFGLCHRSPYFIAEISGNHGGSLENAKELIRQAKKCGADAVKIQSYSPDDLTLNICEGDFLINSGTWGGKALYDLYREAQTPLAWIEPLFKLADDEGITIFSTPFSESAVDLLERFNTPFYKISSLELGHFQLIEKVARTGKPAIFSTGGSSVEEVADSVTIFTEISSAPLALMHCVSCYPTEMSDCHLDNIRVLRERFNLPVGFSDHTKSLDVPVWAVAMGASIIEKHLKLPHVEAVDSSFSFTPNEFEKLSSKFSELREAQGEPVHNELVRPESEQLYADMKRSLYYSKPLSKGHKISIEDVRVVRPGYGLKPKYLKDILGQITVREIGFGERVSFDDFE